tara:strand:+ start:1 stop:933 length:933 start_codon:yes stop_codon:yes gene_type:complete
MFGGYPDDDDEDDDNAKRMREQEKAQRKQEEEKKEKEKKKKEKIKEYYEKIQHIDSNKYENWIVIPDSLNNEIYEDYKYQIYSKLYSKLVETEKAISTKKNDVITETTDRGDVITHTANSIENVFNNLLNKYHRENKKKDKITDEVEDNFYNSVKTNDLNPDIVLEISSNDKIIFIILIFVIRQLSLLIIDTFINNNFLKSLSAILLCYLGIYIGLLIIIIVWVNLDTYKMRILFNYLNFHINSIAVYNHIFLLILFTGIIYYYIYSTDENVREIKYKELSEMEKIEMKYKLDIITLIIFIFTSIVDYLI